MHKLRFGTAGIPLCTPKGGTLNGIRQVRTLGLECMELEFVHSINISEPLAKEVKKTAEKEDIFLTSHGQYFINLNSQEQVKIEASKQRIFNAAKRAWQCGAVSLTFHAAFYMKEDQQKVYQKVKEGVQEVILKLREEDINIFIRPETTGKPTQWGSLKEIVKLSEEVEHVLPCIDFSHLHAREGKNNTFAEFKDNLTLVEKHLGKDALNKMHIHLSGIEYGLKGEKHHLTLEHSDMNYLELLRAFKEFNLKGVVISESPNIERDALLMQQTYKQFNF